jgi:hypothetical protein
MNRRLPVVLDCADAVRRKVRYVFDSLAIARDIPLRYCAEPPATGPWIFYGPARQQSAAWDRCLAIAHCPGAWKLFEHGVRRESATTVDGLQVVLPDVASGFGSPADIAFDMIANAFYFLSSWDERTGPRPATTRNSYSSSVYARLGIPQDIVDRYLERLVARLDALCDRHAVARWKAVEWPAGASHAVVLSHDVDFIPRGPADTALQAAKTALRHLVRQRDPADALHAMRGWSRAVLAGRDPYGCVPEIIERERELGVRASFQVAVGHRHRNDVNYRIEDDAIRDYLRAIPDAGFDLCLHGSYCSTENAQWYVDEVALLTRRLGKPLGSRQHFLSFDYDTLFDAQEQAGIQYDMSMGYADHPGPRAGFSYPYFPYCLEEDRPYDVVELSLFLMDVTLRSYLGLKGSRAWAAIEEALDDLRRKRGCASAVWHPIVFGGARDPGFDELFWRMTDRVRQTGGIATDGATVNEFWRRRAQRHSGSAHASA